MLKRKRLIPDVRMNKDNRKEIWFSDLEIMHGVGGAFRFNLNLGTPETVNGTKSLREDLAQQPASKRCEKDAETPG